MTKQYKITITSVPFYTTTSTILEEITTSDLEDFRKTYEKHLQRCVDSCKSKAYPDPIADGSVGGYISDRGDGFHNYFKITFTGTETYVYGEINEILEDKQEEADTPPSDEYKEFEKNPPSAEELLDDPSLDPRYGNPSPVIKLSGTFGKYEDEEVEVAHLKAVGKISDLEDTLRRIRTRLSLYTPEELPLILADISNALGEFDDVYDMNPTALVKEARRYLLAAGNVEPAFGWFGCEDDAELREHVMESAKEYGLKNLHEVLDAMLHA